MKTTQLRSVAFILPFATALVGCGGSGTTPSANIFAGSYSSSLTLDGGKAGALSMAVTASGVASGTLSVSAPAAARPSRDGFNFSVGTHTISGTVGADGTINISGTDGGTGAGSFTIDGNLSTTGNGSINVRAGGGTYVGTISTSTGGGGAGITLTNAQGTNANTANFPSNPIIILSTVGGSASLIASNAAGAGQRAIGVSMGTDAVTGATISYGNLASFNQIFYTEAGTRNWNATSGTATIVSRTSNSVEIKFNNLTMTAESGTGATGTFVLNGTLKK